MSRTACQVPRQVPVTLDAPVRGRYGDVVLGDPPARVGGAHHHLQRVAAAPVGEAEAEQRLAAGGAHRAEVVQP